MAQQIKNFNGDAIGIVFVIVIPVVIGYLFSIVNLIYGIAFGVILFLIFLVAALRIVNQWNRKAVLSFGKYVGIMGPGIHIIIPFIQTTPITLDLRVMNTVFKAEKTLTKDNVPVDVDALLFWKVINSESAVLNVQFYRDSVQLAAQTALRDIIGKAELSEMLAGRDVIGRDVKNLIVERVSDWGIETISVEIRDVSIPPDLQDAMARVAVAEREKQARVKLAESESLAADKMIEASEKYKKDLFAMQLRSLNMMYEISLNGKNLMVFVPTDSKGFSIPTPVGVEGIKELFSKSNPKNVPGDKTKKPKNEEKEED
ncbi:MAG: band 7 protein [Candidatus Parvarchaeum acidophilus ARMAN-5]|jgi:regulator of protease activity HflC (stomatin/prohibitin superfamily)|uniref:Band 7 protein n=1 Tax=Candidatus Parvarchaeum acidophilus ARMAN-5 TaxID=662762 RepID=D6GUR1_PARA5|nr:MAG: band 7 protein [Candidatus Parvarchaeum acidophilus ARMAN-5]